MLRALLSSLCAVVSALLLASSVIQFRLVGSPLTRQFFSHPCMVVILSWICLSSLYLCNSWAWV